MGKRDRAGVGGIRYPEDSAARACSRAARGTCVDHGVKLRWTTYGFPCAPEEEKK